VKPEKPDADKLRRANAWSGLVEGGTVLFGADQHELVRAMLAVPDDKNQWDLVDAAGLCIRGFQKLEPAQMMLPRGDAGANRARGYAVRPPDAPEPDRRSQIQWPTGPTPSSRRRAIGYAIR
jgi:hypothetical protein